MDCCLRTIMAYNTRTVLAGTSLLGMCAGAVGTFMLLQKKAAQSAMSPVMPPCPGS